MNARLKLPFVRLAGVSLLALVAVTVSVQAASSPGFRWAARFGTPGSASENTRDMAVDGSGNTVVLGNATGQTMSFDGPTVSNVFSVNASSSYIAKYDSAGNPVWHCPTTFSMQRVAVDPAGNVYVLGSVNGTATIGPSGARVSAQSIGFTDAVVGKLNPNGTPIWIRQFGSVADDYANTFAGPFEGACIGGIAIAPSGSIYFTFGYGGDVTLAIGGGTTTLRRAAGSQANAQDTAIIQLDPNGNVLAATSLGGSDTEVPRDLAIDIAGNVVVLGVSSGNITLGADSVTNRAAQFLFCKSSDHQVAGWVTGSMLR